MLTHLDVGTDVAKIEESQWRCAACYADLSYVYTMMYEIKHVVDKVFDQWLGIHAGSQLENLLLTNYGDVYDDLNDEARRNFVGKDIALINKFFNNAYQTVLQIGVNLSRNELDHLRATFPAITYCWKPQSDHMAKLVMYELTSLLIEFKPKDTRNKFRIMNCPVTIYPAQQNIITVTDVASADALICDGENITLETITTNHTRSKILLWPKLHAPSNQFGDVKYNDGNYLFQYGLSSRIGTINKELHDTLSKFDVIVTNTSKFLLTHLMETDNWVCTEMTTLPMKMNTNNWKRTKMLKYKRIAVPLPDMLKGLSNNSFQLWSEVDITFDQSLHNNLVMRNLVGNLG